MIKLVLFSGHWLVTEIEEIPGTELGDPDCVLKYACEVTEDGLQPFPPYSDDQELVVRSENITIVSEPKPMYLALYHDLKDKE